MPDARRPRVAIIGLDNFRLASIEPLCGDPRPNFTLGAYQQEYNWTETDLVIAGTLEQDQVNVGVNLLTIGPTSFEWTDRYRAPGVASSQRHRANTRSRNTERELAVSAECPERYRPLAAELAAELRKGPQPPLVMTTTRDSGVALIETTSGHAVALRFVLPTWQDLEGKEHNPIALLLPEGANLAAWFRVFLSDIHDLDPSRVPHAPPRSANPSHWYTPQEKALAGRIEEIGVEIGRLRQEREERQAELTAAGERADRGIRRALWADGEELVAAVGEILADLGFTVRDMDAERQGQPKREDMRLTLTGVSEWEAMAEVKGSSSGTKTNDTRQIREQRDLFIAEKGRAPNLTLWLCNPHRMRDPSSRRAPSDNVREAAENIGAVHVLVTDLYRQWALVAAGELEAEAVVQSLIDAPSGLWTPPAPDTNT
ncbi:MAG: hypothetical protein OXI51_12680 [Chloroflexota bacterium]|nr:hypothetical protein [Chloroflexota bacterium]